MKIKYGLSNNNIDVTAICTEKLLTNNIITIPKGDHNRAYLFTDPLFNIHKKDRLGMSLCARPYEMSRDVFKILELV